MTMNPFKLDQSAEYKSKTIILEGGIGAGKSWMLNHLAEYYTKKYNEDQVVKLPEYIEEKEGKLMFNKYKNQKISEEIFQWYILSYWNRVLDKKQEARIRLIERGPSAGFAFTSKEAFCTERGWREFKEALHECVNKYIGKDFRMFVFTQRQPVEEIVRVIEQSGSRNIIIFFFFDIPTMLSGILERGRPEEKAISAEYLVELNKRLLGLYCNNGEFCYMLK